MALLEECEDRGIFPVMLKLSACLELELERCGIPASCFHGLIPGAGIAMHDIDCDGRNGCTGGQATVRLISTFPSTSFPQPDQVAGLGVKLAYQIEVAVVRCVPVFSNENGRQQGSSATVAEELEATRIAMADMAAMHRAIVCCIKGLERPHHYALGEYIPLTAEGGLGGGAWSLAIQAR